MTPRERSLWRGRKTPGRNEARSGGRRKVAGREAPDGNVVRRFSLFGRKAGNLNSGGKEKKQRIVGDDNPSDRRKREGVF